MTAPIPVRVTRYRCPHCARSHSTRTRCVQHIGRCWRNPDARGCKTCIHFGVDITGYGEDCVAGVNLQGKPACDACQGVGWDPLSDANKRPTCGGEGRAVKPGPIVGCPLWQPLPNVTTATA